MQNHLFFTIVSFSLQFPFLMLFTYFSFLANFTVIDTPLGGAKQQSSKHFNVITLKLLHSNMHVVGWAHNATHVVNSTL